MRLLVPIILVLLLPLGPVTAAEVVVYTSLDQVYSEPFLREFEARTGVDVKTLYDVEASKTSAQQEQTAPGPALKGSMRA